MKMPPLFFYQIYPQNQAVELLVASMRITRPFFILIIVLIYCAASYPLVTFRTILMWVVLNLLAASCILGYTRRFGDISKRQLSLNELRHAEWAHTGSRIFASIAFGYTAHLIVPGAFVHNFFLTLFGVGSLVGAVSSRFHSPIGLSVTIITAFVTAVTALPALQPEHWPWISAGFALLSIWMIKTGLEKNPLVIANLQLRDEKQQLLESQQLETERANQASRDKSAFLAAASHDLRQPLHALMLTSHALALRLPQGENQELVSRILEAGQALTTQFNQLLDLSQLESDRYRLKPANTAITDLLQQIVTAHRSTAEHRQVRLLLRVSPRLQSRALFIDGALLRRVIDNLIDNAIKFSPARGRVLVSARQRQGRIWLRVQDQGAGIPEKQQESIFKPYVQLDNPTRDRNQGIGLGLSIARQATSLLGGELRLHSRMDRGSCFTVTLPDTLLCDRQTTPPHVDMPHTDRLRGKHLLLVEDDALAAAALVTWGKAWELTVTHFADPRAVPETPAPDLILCDIRLPGARDGIDWLAEWLGQWPQSRGLLLSGEQAAETHQRAEQEGLLLLTKPVPPDQLLRTLVGLL